MKIAFVFFLFLAFNLGCTSSSKSSGDPDAFYSQDSYLKLKTDYNFIAATGRGHRLFRDSEADFIVAIFIQTKLQTDDIKWLRELTATARLEDSKKFDFRIISLDDAENRNNLLKIGLESELQNPVLSDSLQISAIDLNIQYVPEVIVFSRKSRRLISRLGKVTADQLKTILTDIQKGRPKLLTETKNGRSEIKLSKTLTDESKISYSKTIAPIFLKNCVSCHYQDGPAPWAMDSYKAITEWKNMIREVVALRRMPPSQTDSYYRKYKNEYRLSNEEVQKLIRWIDQGLPKDNANDPLSMYKRPAEKKFPLGKPDLILKLPEQKVGANDPENVQLVRLEWPLRHFQRIRGLDLQTDNNRAVHHVTYHYLVPDLSQPDKSKVMSFAGSYFPGYEPNFYPQNASYTIPPDVPIRVSVHTIPTGKDEVVNLQAAFYFDDKKESPELRHCSITTHNFNIPPFEKNYSRKVTGRLTEDTRIIQVGIHMHKRGRNVKFTAKLPNNKEEVIISIPNYNYNWQKDYLLSEPLFLPKGTTLTCEAQYDNSLSNPFLRDASKRITYGWHTDEEMLNCYCYSLRENDYQNSLNKNKKNNSTFDFNENPYIINDIVTDP